MHQMFTADRFCGNVVLVVEIRLALTTKKFLFSVMNFVYFNQDSYFPFFWCFCLHVWKAEKRGYDKNKDRILISFKDCKIIKELQ